MELIFCKTQLSLIRNYEFYATSNKNDGWKGIGQGTVRIEIDQLGNFIFFEDGFFENSRGKFTSHNIYRWSFKYLNNSISLEHLRFGVENPVFLFDMVCEQDSLWSSKCPHLCDRDEYHAKMLVENSCIKLEWDIINNKDYNRIEYKYFL